MFFMNPINALQSTFLWSIMQVWKFQTLSICSMYVFTVRTEGLLYKYEDQLLVQFFLTVCIINVSNVFNDRTLKSISFNISLELMLTTNRFFLFQDGEHLLKLNSINENSIKKKLQETKIKSENMQHISFFFQHGENCRSIHTT